MIPSDEQFKRILTIGIMVLLILVGLMASLAYGEEVSQVQSYGQYSEADGIGRWVMFSGFSQQEAFEFNKFTNFLIGAEAQLLEIQLSNGGGDLFPALSMIDNIRLLQQNGVAVVTRATGMCASACAMLFSYGDKRVIGANSWLMFHSLSSSVSGSHTLHSIIARAQFLERLQREINIGLATQLELSYEQLVDIMSADTWLTADDALRLGIATHIE